MPKEPLSPIWFGISFIVGLGGALLVVGVWLGMVLDWAVRGVLFYFRMVSGRWLWKYPRVKASSEES